jgi:hypothetical protein
MKHLEIVRTLFAWYTQNLVYDAHLKKSEIQHYFAETFLVKANGKSYDANDDNYFEFLNQFRSTIRKISYDFGDFITDKTTVVIPLRAQIIRIDDSVDHFEAILILKFNHQDKIILWHELYLKLPV